MELKNYIDVLIQAPLAIILMFFVYRVLQLFSELIKEVTKILKKE